MTVDNPDHIYVECAALPQPVFISHGITGPLGMPVTLSVRPERVRLTRSAPENAPNVAAGKVCNIAYMGSYTLYHVMLASGKNVMANVSTLTFDNVDPPSYDEEVFVSWAPDAVTVLTK